MPELKGGTVPFTITHELIRRRPQVETTHRFVGWGGVLRRVALAVIETIDKIAYEKEERVVDPGEVERVDWSVQIEEPWTTEDQTTLIVSKSRGAHPSGMRFVMSQIVEEGARFPSEAEWERQEHIRRNSAVGDDGVARV